MLFNEKTHAYLAAKYYVYLTELFGKRGEKAFIHATQYHSLQRGRRMAQLAIRNGEELTYSTFRRYGEWVPTGDWIPTEEEKEKLKNHPPAFYGGTPTCVHHVLACPWHAQFKEMNLPDAGETYCAHLDNSICRGFNPYIRYEIPQTMHKHGCCIQIVSPSDMNPEETYEKRLEGLKSFEYHCACSFWAYYRVTLSIFEEEGHKVNELVKEDIQKDYGPEAIKILLSYRNMNFDVLEEEQKLEADGFA